MRVKLVSIATAFLLITTYSNAQVKDQQLIKFWQNSDYRIANKLTSDVVRAVYYRFVIEFYPKKNMFEVIATIENIRKDYKLQDYMFLSFLLAFGKDDFFLKTELADICGTYTLGNYVADYIKRRYLNDKRYVLAIKQRKKTQLNKENNQVPPNEEIPEIKEQQVDSLKTSKED